jgi:hypothetical protein
MKVPSTISVVPSKDADKALQELASAAALFSREVREALQGKLNLGNLDSQIVMARVTGGEPVWTAPTFAANYAQAGGGLQAVGYQVEPGGRVNWRGVIHRTAGVSVGGEAVATVPPGCYPTLQPAWVCWGPATGMYFPVGTPNTLAIATAGVTDVYLDAIAYQAASPVAPAIPHTGVDWPLRLKLNLWGQPKLVLLIDAVEVADASSPLIRGPVAWALSADGQSVEIQCPWDLQPGRVYELTFLILGGD